MPLLYGPRGALPENQGEDDGEHLNRRDERRASRPTAPVPEVAGQGRSGAAAQRGARGGVLKAPSEKPAAEQAVEATVEASAAEAKAAAPAAAAPVAAPPAAEAPKAPAVRVVKAADIEAEESRTFVALLDELQFKSAQQTCDEMAKELMKSNMRPSDKDMWQRYAELRYRGQHHTLRIAWHSQDTAQTLRQRFENAYQQRYGHVTQNAKVEFVSLHTVLRQPVEQPDLEKMAQQATAQAQSTPTVVKRQVYLGSTHQFHDVPVYQRNALPIGYTIQGPALIEEYGSTCLIDVGDRLHVGRLAELVIDVCPKV